jgi:hypothetical protein
MNASLINLIASLIILFAAIIPIVVKKSTKQKITDEEAVANNKRYRLPDVPAKISIPFDILLFVGIIGFIFHLNTLVIICSLTIHSLFKIVVILIPNNAPSRFEALALSVYVTVIFIIWLVYAIVPI